MDQILVQWNIITSFF